MKTVAQLLKLKAQQNQQVHTINSHQMVLEALMVMAAKNVGANAVTDIAIRYAASARLDDDLVVESRLIEVSAVRVVIHQTVRCGTVKLTDARVTVAWVGPNGRPRRQPADWIAIYQRLVWQGDTQHP